ncbi:MAG: phage tail tape measure protein [Bacteroidetes bacterium]|nr:phage tail tape measure protein [Bacteroidota bacterium]
MDKTLSGGVNIYLNEAELAKQIERLSKQAETLNTKIANGSNAAKLTEEALKKMGDKEAELQKLQRASEALAKEIKQVEEYGGDATSRLREMGNVTSAITKVETQINSLKNSIQAAAKSEKDLNENMAQLASVKDKIAIVEKQMRGELSPSIKQAGDAVRRLYNEYLSLPQGSEAAAAKLKEFDKANAVFTEMKGQISGVGKAYETLVSQVKSVSIGVIIGNSVEAGVEKVISGVTGLFSLRNEFESSVANLRAITGATGEDLDYLKNKAIEMSQATSNSARDYVEAFKLIASAKPELLADREGLVQVAEAATLLSRAAGIQLPDAATRLTDALNQFGAPASEAKKYVDALAAASKYGAAEVPDVTEALLQFGSVAKASKVDIYESAGAIELLAEKGQKGAEAGTKLRNVLINMASAKGLDEKALASLKAYGVNLDIVTDSSKSFDERLKELSKVGGDTTAVVNVFGKENAVAAQVLLNNLPRYEELTKQIKEQGVANVQAADNTKVLSSSWNQFKNIVSSIFLINLDNSFLTKFVQGLSAGAKAIADWIKNSRPLSETFALNLNYLILLATAYAAYNAAVVVATVKSIYYAAVKTAENVVERASAALKYASALATGAYQVAVALLTGELTLATAASRAYQLATAAATGGVTLIVGAVITAAGAMLAYANSMRTATQVAQELDKVRTTALKATVEERTNLELLLAVARDSALSMERRQKAIEDINKISPEYLGNITLETINTNESKKAIDQYIESIEKKALAQATQNRLVELYRDKLDAQTKTTEESVKWYQKLNAYIASGTLTYQDYNTLEAAAAENRKEEIKTIDAKIEALKKLAVANVAASAPGAAPTTEDKPTKTLDLDPDADKKRKKELEEMRKFMEELEKLRNENAILGLDEDAKALAAVRTKYEAMFDFAKAHFGENGKITQELERFYADEVNRIGDQRTEKKFAETYKNRLTLVNNVYGELKQAAGDDRAAVLAIEVSEYDARAELAKTYTGVVKSAAADQVKAEADAAKARIELAQEVARRVREAQTIHDDTDLLIAQIKNDTDLETKALLQQLDHRYADEKVKYKNNKQALLELDRWYEAQKEKITKDANRKVEQNTLSAYQNLSSSVTSLFSSIIAISNQQSENELQDFKNKNDAKKEALKARLDAGIINQSEYNSQVALLDNEFAKKQAEIKSDQARKNRDAQIIEATATGLVTVLNAYNTGVAIPVAGIVLGPTMAALAAGVVAAQIALLATTPVPQFAKGGVAQGASHAQGGIALVDSTSGRKVGEMEGGEPYVILSRESYRNNGVIIDALLDSSMNRGGAPIDLRATRMQPRFDYGGIFSIAKFANGGVFSANNVTGSTDPRVIALLQSIASQTSKPSRSYVVLDDIATGATRLSNARNRGSFLNQTS